MEIVAETVYDYPAIKALFRLQLAKSRYHTLRYVLTLVLFSLVVAVSLINMIIRFRTIVPIPFFLTIFGSVMIFIYLFGARLTYKQMKFGKNMPNRYVFGEQELHVHSHTAQFSGECTLSYDRLYKVYELKRYFILYIDRAQAYLIAKDGIQNASPEAFRDFIQSSLPPKKYVRCK